MKSRPNVLFFFTDDQRYDAVGAVGDVRVRTPNLDALAARGTAFTRAHIPGGTCGAVCMPSRAMLHTGRTLFHLDREGQEIPAAHVTMGEQFRRAGYATHGIGKWHNGKAAFARGFSGGDEIFFGGMADHWNVPVHRFDPTGRYEGRCARTVDPFHSNRVEWSDADHIAGGRHSTDLLTDAAVRFLRDRSRAEPFFLYVSLLAPHDPRTMPRRFRDLYDPASIELPPNFLRAHPIDTGALRIRDELLAAWPRDPAEIRRHIAEYFAMITHLDDAFGRLMAVLRETGEEENTIVVMAGDNGLAVGQHGLMGKQSLYEHSVRVPLLFAGPGIPANARRADLVYLLDLFPTLCDLCGLPVPESVEGRSLAPALGGAGTGSARSHLYLAYERSIRGVTDGRIKLIEYACGATQLFDLVEDPAETRNRAGDPAWRGRLTEFRARLRSLAEEWEDERHPAGRAFWADRHRQGVF